MSVGGEQRQQTRFRCACWAIGSILLSLAVPDSACAADVFASIRSDANAVSPKSARGAIQLMPAAAERYGLRGPHSWRDPERNLDGVPARSAPLAAP